jgi:hypothetical protein
MSRLEVRVVKPCWIRPEVSGSAAVRAKTSPIALLGRRRSELPHQRPKGGSVHSKTDGIGRRKR